MPLVDVSELLSDPDFATTFDVISGSATVGPDGVNRISPTPVLGVVGVVQPANSSDLQRLPDGEYQRGAQTIYTRYPLTSGGAGKTADLIRWPALTGPWYTAQTVDDWSQWGAGYVKIVATLADINP